jgi:hypothetical protein
VSAERTAQRWACPTVKPQRSPPGRGAEAPKSRRKKGRAALPPPDTPIPWPTSSQRWGLVAVDRPPWREGDYGVCSPAIRYRNRMDNIQDQIRELQTSVRRQRFAIVALASVLTSIALIGAVRPVGDAAFDTITCKAWKVVDKDGKDRILASTTPEGAAGVVWVDRDEKLRIAVATGPDGKASVAWVDKYGKGRISAGTYPDGKASVNWLDNDGKSRITAATMPDGAAAVAWADKDGGPRIGAGTHPDGNASVHWFDNDGKPRIVAATLPNGLASVVINGKDGKGSIVAGTYPDGTVVYPTKDGQ